MNRESGCEKTTCTHYPGPFHVSNKCLIRAEYFPSDQETFSELTCLSNWYRAGFLAQLNHKATRNLVNMSDSMDSAPAAQPVGNELVSPLLMAFKRILAGNPFYLASAGLLLYGINQLTTDPKLVGAEFPMLRFNFCALLLYEIMLVGTAIALIRRRIWYDAMLLFGLTNLFIIVPFSLISRAVFLSPHLALVMSLAGAALAAAKFWAFKRYAPELNLPRRLLIIGAMLLLINAYAPLLFKGIATDADQITKWLNFIWLFLLPAFAGLGLFLPRQASPAGAPGGRRWLPATVFFAWILVTTCHFGGIGYSNSYVWKYSLLVPVAWVAAWTIQFRFRDFVTKPNPLSDNIRLYVPLLLPLLAIDSERILLIFACLNLMGYGLLWLRERRSFPALIRLLGAIAIFSGGQPTEWLDQIVPAGTRAEWIFLSTFVCFFWLIFRSRNPKVALFAALGLAGFSMVWAPDLSRYAIQVALVSLLAHSLRWDDEAHRGATMLRSLTGVLWVLISCSWLFGPVQPARLLVDSAAALLLLASLMQALAFRNRKHLFVLVCAGVVLLSEPTMISAKWLAHESVGMVAIGGSFLLFALGSLAAFSKPKWWRSG